MDNLSFPELFEGCEDWQMNACVGFSHDMSHGYIEGYLRAADCLVEHVAVTGKDQDYFVYPVAFMYRHYLELQLKNIINIGRQLLENGGGHPSHHKLHNLWPLAKGILRKTWGDNPEPEEYKTIDRFVEEFSKVDSDSIGFRYPREKSGGVTLRGVRLINLRNIAECVHSFSTFLDGCSTCLQHYLDNELQCLRDNTLS